MKWIALLPIILITSVCLVKAQVSISTSDSTPDPSAMLDVQSTDKGILIPRMSTAQRALISNPATGLLVFDSDAGGFWFYNGTEWEDLSGGDDLGSHVAAGDINLANNWVNNGTASTGLKINDNGMATLRTNSGTTLGLQLQGGNTPALRFYQDGSQWPAYVWDISGNETTFFIRDVTAGSKLPVKIKSGSESNRIVIDGQEVGIATDDPEATLDVNGQIRMRIGATDGFVPVSDSNGVMTWSDPIEIADNLGNHTATDTVRLEDHMITNGGSEYGIQMNSDGTIHSTAKDLEPNLTVETHNTPFIRFDQTFNEAWDPYTWDLGGHELYFFLNDEIAGTHPFKLYTGQSNNRLVIRDDRLGVGTDLPTATLDVNGQIRMRTGAAAGRIPVSDADGIMTWTDAISINSDTNVVIENDFNVGGEIAFGDNQEYKLIAMSDNANMVCGIVDVDGGFLGNFNSGVTSVDHQETGRYRVHFASGTFTGFPVVSVTMNHGFVIGCIKVHTTTNAWVDIRAYDIDGEPVDVAFNITAVGPR